MTTFIIIGIIGALGFGTWRFWSRKRRKNAAAQQAQPANVQPNYICHNHSTGRRHYQNGYRRNNYYHHHYHHHYHHRKNRQPQTICTSSEGASGCLTALSLPLFMITVAPFLLMLFTVIFTKATLADVFAAWIFLAFWGLVSGAVCVLLPCLIPVGILITFFCFGLMDGMTPFIITGTLTYIMYMGFFPVLLCK